MKKRDFVDRVWEKFEHNHVEIDDVEAIVEICIELGMLPPSYPKKCLSAFGDRIDIFYTNEWEDTE